MSVSRGGSGVGAGDGINIATVGDVTADTGGGGQDYRIDPHLPDKHVMAVHAIRASLSDLYDAQSGQMEVWVFDNQDFQHSNDWTGRLLSNDNFVWHTNLGFGTNSDASDAGTGPYSDQTTFPLPLLIADGMGVEQSGTDETGGDLEWEVSVYFDIVPVETTDDYLELLMRR